jgi:hypothetical protein
MQKIKKMRKRVLTKNGGLTWAFAKSNQWLVLLIHPRCFSKVSQVKGLPVISKYNGNNPLSFGKLIFRKGQPVPDENPSNL